jgi:hypothetical protein
MSTTKDKDSENRSADAVENFKEGVSGVEIAKMVPRDP